MLRFKSNLGCAPPHPWQHFHTQNITQSCKGTYQGSGLPIAQVHIHLQGAADFESTSGQSLCRAISMGQEAARCNGLGTQLAQPSTVLLSSLPQSWAHSSRSCQWPNTLEVLRGWHKQIYKPPEGALPSISRGACSTTMSVHSAIKHVTAAPVTSSCIIHRLTSVSWPAPTSSVFSSAFADQARCGSGQGT